ncbi:MAG: ATP-binding cassette domain-containing protein [Promethearchaeota archaeon]
MKIKIRGANEHNLKAVDVDIGDGLTVVTGVSGSGKTSLIFDTLYKEARRRFLEAFAVNRDEIKQNPAKVQSITGLSPTIALGQNLLNRNPNSIVASASGLLPLIKILYARFGERKCHVCGAKLTVLKKDEIIAQLEGLAKSETVNVSALLVKKVVGSHKTLIDSLVKEFSPENVIIDGIIWNDQKLDPKKPHDIQIFIGQLNQKAPLNQIRDITQTIAALGAYSLIIEVNSTKNIISRIPACVECGTWFEDLNTTHFKKNCPHCKGKGCKTCSQTGLHPLASRVTWSGLSFLDFLNKSIGKLLSLFSKNDLPTVDRLILEIKKRLTALHSVGLDYLTLNRISPTLSRGESQRVRLAIALLSELEDITHILDEPTIGQHPADVARLLPVLNKLAGPVIYIEHDRQAAASADYVIDIGPGAGNEGGEIVFVGTPAELWKVDTPSGKYFSLREKVKIPKKRPKPHLFLTINGAKEHNLNKINIRIPLNRLTVITGVSGSGKSTFIENVLFTSLKKKKSIGCDSIKGPELKPVIVDQGPIGKNPRSNPATYTKISDVIRKLFAKLTKFSATHFSFNTEKGTCPTCKGMGALEIKMRYLPSTWLTCSECNGQRFSDEILSEKVKFGDEEFSIAEFYELPISKIISLFKEEIRLPAKDLTSIRRMLKALNDIGLGYLSLGQPSPTLSGGEAQRVKLSKYLARNTIENQLIILDEPSTGLHPQNLAGLLSILDRLIKAGATIVIVEHNIDIIKSADWIIDLGPGSGPKGGNLIYEGPFDGLMDIKESLTAQALKAEEAIIPASDKNVNRRKISSNITIKNAHIHNLKNIDVEIPKGKFIVVTGVSGSGKSSLIMDTLEAEARRRYLETLSMYERQGTKEGQEALVDDIIGLSITALIIPEKIRQGWFFNLRNTIGKITDLNLHLANLFAYVGKRPCPKCGQWMIRKEKWYCEKCDITFPIAKPKHFISSNYAAACLKCNGIGSNQIPNPAKLIIHPDKPLCKGAMYSPGFFPKGYLCKPYNMGYYVVQALADRYGFDQFNTPWNEMSKEAQKAFLHGVDRPLQVHVENKKGQLYTKDFKYQGFYKQWLRDWDVGGTYTDIEPCDECHGTQFRPQYLDVYLYGYNIHQINDTPLSELYKIFNIYSNDNFEIDFVANSFKIILARLNFLNRTGLGYIHLNRVTESLSAGEIQRVRLASLLGSNLTSLTILLDEPSRGLHPSELQALIDVLVELKNKGNTIITIEHDLLFIECADYLIEMGPGAGINGGKVVASGSQEKIRNAKTITAGWLNKSKKFKIPTSRRKPKKWLKIHGARVHNLKGDLVEIPHNVLVGICGVSGSGKSSLFIDTLGRALSPQKHTTSVAYEPLKPGMHDKIEEILSQTIIIDQKKEKIGSPLKFLGLERPITKIFVESEDAKIIGLVQEDFTKRCSVCRGKGFVKTDMKFLPDIINTCDICNGSGYQAEARKVHFQGISLPEVSSLTIDEALELFKEHETIATKLKLSQDVGLGYLQLNQPAHTLSGGEAQRLKIVKELSKKTKKETLYILDEPTIGQHLEDVSRLIEILHLLVEKDHTVIVIEHHPHLLVSCDWLIELGPGGGREGGHIIATGTPETISNKDTPTAPYLKELLEEGN